MKVVLNIFNLFDKPIRLLQTFFDELSDGYNVEMLIKTYAHACTHTYTVDGSSMHWWDGWQGVSQFKAKFEEMMLDLRAVFDTNDHGVVITVL